MLCVRAMQLLLACVPAGAPCDGEERQVRRCREQVPQAGGGILLCGASPGALYWPLQVNGLLSMGGNVNFKHDNQVIQLFGLSVTLLIPTMTCAWLSRR